MRVVLVALVALVAACGTREEKMCEALRNELGRCENPIPSEALERFQDFCVLAMQTSDMKAPFESCAKERGCREVGACLERHGCTFVLTGPSDRVPELFCFPGGAR